MSTNIQGIERPAPRVEKTVVDVQDSNAVLAAYAQAMKGGTVSVIPSGDMTKPYETTAELTNALGPMPTHGTQVSRSELRILRDAYRASAWRYFKESLQAGVVLRLRTSLRSQWQVVRYIAKAVTCQYLIWRTPRI